MIFFRTFYSYSVSDTFHGRCRETYTYIAIATDYFTLGGQAASTKSVILGGTLRF